MDKSAITNILAAYDLRVSLLTSFESRTRETIKNVLATRGVKVHSVEGRVKTRISLQDKVKSIGKSYKSLDDVKDLVGLRIITYFEDEVDRLAGIIENEFELVKEHCVDKRKSLEPNAFGYLSLHYVCKWPESRLVLTENSGFRNLEFEIQIRSLLQHTWAEIEHDLGYKAGSEVPPAIRRRFSQLAGLLEVADREFREVRETLAAYVAEIRTSLRMADSATPLDSISLAVFLSESATVAEIDRWLCEWMEGTLADSLDDPDVLLSMVQLCGITTVEHLDQCLRSNKNSFFVYIRRRFPRIWATGEEAAAGWYAKGSSIWLMAHPLALAAGGIERLKELMTNCVKYPKEALADALGNISECASNLEWKV